MKRLWPFFVVLFAVVGGTFLERPAREVNARFDEAPRIIERWRDPGHMHTMPMPQMCQTTIATTGSAGQVVLVPCSATTGQQSNEPRRSNSPYNWKAR